jgi:hypothetical protein
MVRSNTPSKEYLNALECFWSGRPQTAIERVSMLLADEPDREDRLRLYRLWVEILASVNEFGTLKSLTDHLHLLGVMHPALAAPLLAIRGIAYLEIDDFAAASLSYRAVKSHKECDYCDELKFRIEARLNIQQSYTDLVARINNLEDYFHIREVAVLALNRGQKTLLDSIAKRAVKLFPSSPLLNEIKMHRAADQGQWAQMATYAAELYKSFAGNLDYAFYNGYALAKQNLDEQAIAVLERSIALGADKDVDINGLLARLYARHAATKGDTSLQSRVDHYQQQSNRLLEDEGMTFEKASITSSTEAVKAWMLKLNAKDYFDIREKRDGQLKSVTKSIDQNAKPGDIVFLVGDDYKNQSEQSQQWRLAAVYIVDSLPEWHPIDGYTASFSLVSKLQSAIPFDVRFPKADSVDTAVIALDIDAIDAISDAIEEYRDFDIGAVRVLENIEQTRLSS